MAYITEGDLENFILQDIDNSFSSFITSIISFVEDYIDQYCGTDFQNSTSSTRYFDTEDSNECFIGEVQSLTVVQILDIQGSAEDTLTATTDYYLYPLNETIKDRIVLSESGKRLAFTKRVRGLLVTGTWGRSTAPNPVKLAAIQLAAKLINEGLRGGQVSGETLGSYRIDYREVDESAESLGIKDILNRYKVMQLV